MGDESDSTSIGTTRMRKSITGLLVMVQEKFRPSSASGAFFAYREPGVIGLICYIGMVRVYASIARSSSAAHLVGQVAIMPANG